MTKSAILLILTLLIGGLAGYLGRDDAASRRALPQIDSLARQGETLLISGRHAEDCAAPLQSVVHAFPHNLDIQLYRDIPSAAVCGLQEINFTLELAFDAAHEADAVIINDRLWLAQGADTVEASLFPAWIDQAALMPAQDGSAKLRLRGSQAVGCKLPLLFTWRETSVRASLGVFNGMDAADVCPDAQVEFDQSVNLPATEALADTLFAVNGILISELETQNVSDTDKVLTNISQVDVTVAGQRLSLAIAGEHPDGCDFPVIVDQRRDGSRVQIEVYREVPADVFCPMILQPYQDSLQIDGTFAAGEYTIQVNAHSQTIDIPGA